MNDGSGVGNMAALVAGTVSFLSPCVLPLVPAYLSYIAGEAIDEARDPPRHARLFTLALSTCFVLGFSLVFIALVASATAIDRVAGNPFSALLLGMAFAFGWTPCIGPVLGGVLTISATQNDVGTGIRLLAAYSLGLGLPFILTALFLRRAVTHLKRLRTVGLYLQWGAGS